MTPFCSMWDFITHFKPPSLSLYPDTFVIYQSACSFQTLSHNQQKKWETTTTLWNWSFACAVQHQAQARILCHQKENHAHEQFSWISWQCRFISPDAFLILKRKGPFYHFRVTKYYFRDVTCMFSLCSTLLMELFSLGHCWSRILNISSNMGARFQSFNSCLQQKTAMFRKYNTLLLQSKHSCENCWV